MQFNPSNERLRQLLSRYKDGISTPSEIKEMFAYFHSNAFDGILEEDLKEEFEKEFTTQKEPEIRKKIFRIPPFYRYGISAAAVVGIAFLAYFFLFNKNNNTRDERHLIVKEEMHPGHKQATLILANGKVINLDSSITGNLAVLGGTVVSLRANGELKYEPGAANETTSLEMNTISVPTGGFFKLVLADGSIVWLNSESELNFPTRFSKGERVVSLKGEGYFEITKNTKKPFKVKLESDEEVTVLGTVFNVMAYKNEPAQKITLLEGSIQFSQNGQVHKLRPGEQVIAGTSDLEVKNDVDINHEIAWKNGLFDFNNEDLPAIMRKISRWYKADIVFNGTTHTGHYTGAIRKSATISEVLKMLEVAGDVNFSVIGNKIIVNEK